MKNAFLLTILAATLLVGCNEPEDAKAPAPELLVPTAASSGVDQLMKLAECSAVSTISSQVYTLASQGVPLEDIQSTVFDEVTEADGPIFGLLQKSIALTAEEANKMLADPTQVYAQVHDLSRLWSAEIFNLCATNQL